MKKIILISLIFFLIVITTLTKNSTKNLESEIFVINEEISVLKDQYELVLLDYNFLSSPKKLLEYQAKYFESDLMIIDITNIQVIKKVGNELIISEFKDY